MGDARRRKAINPMFGKMPQSEWRLYEVFKETLVNRYQKHGRGCHVTSSKHQNIRVNYATENDLKGNFGEMVRKFDAGEFEKLQRLVETYDPQSQGVHLHLSVDLRTGKAEVAVSEFPLSVDVDSGEIDPRSREVFQHFLEGVKMLDASRV